MNKYEIEYYCLKTECYFIQVEDADNITTALSKFNAKGYVFVEVTLIKKVIE
jgi:hypothetical protein